MPADPVRHILLTSALPYANGPLHLGHILETIQADIWARFQRLRGHRCHYICADDAHGTAIMLKAEEEGISPEALIAKVQEEHRRDFAGFHITFDSYYTTHSVENRELSQYGAAGRAATLPSISCRKNWALLRGLSNCRRQGPCQSDPVVAADFWLIGNGARPGAYLSRDSIPCIR